MLEFFKQCWDFIFSFKKNDEIKDNSIKFNYPNEETDFFIYEEDAYYNIQISDI